MLTVLIYAPTDSLQRTDLNMIRRTAAHQAQQLDRTGRVTTLRGLEKRRAACAAGNTAGIFSVISRLLGAMLRVHSRGAQSRRAACPRLHAPLDQSSPRRAAWHALVTAAAAVAGQGVFSMGWVTRPASPARRVHGLRRQAAARTRRCRRMLRTAWCAFPAPRSH